MHTPTTTVDEAPTNEATNVKVWNAEEDVETVKSPGDFESVVLGGERSDPARHAIVECEYARWANRALGRSDLFVYRHTGTGNMFLAFSLCRAPRHDGRGGVFVSLEELRGGVPGHATCEWSPDLHWLRLRLRPWAEHHREIMAAAKEREYERRAHLVRDTESRLEFAKFLKARGKSETAMLYERGFSTWSE